MEITKIDSKTLKKTTTLEEHIDKDKLLLRKSEIEKQLTEINDLLKEFDK